MIRRSHLRAATLTATLALVVTCGENLPAQAKPTNRLTVPKAAAVHGGKVPAKPAPADRTAKRDVKPSTAPVHWPEPGAATVAPHGRAEAGTLPVRSAAGAAGPVRVEVLDRARTARGSRPEVLLRVRQAGAGAAAGPVTLSVDASAFRTAYGADWAGRLRWVALPECALSTPDNAGCQGTPVTSTDAGGWVTARVTAAAAAAPGAVYALASAPSGSSGSYAATKLSPSATWTGGDSSGDFTWNYDVRVPPAPGGLAPKVSLSYSSQSVDGMTAASNNQPGSIGQGFDYWPGSITRGYKACNDDKGGPGANNPSGPPIGDLCWGSYNATMTLNGKTVELIRDDASGAYHPRKDDGTRIEHLTGASNGADGGEYWRVTTTNGVQYYFGLNHLPGWVSGKPTTNSAWTVPVYGNNTGEPHYHAGDFADSSVNQAWQWNLDYVVDPHGDSMSYWYTTESNSYDREANAAKLTSYIRGGTLAHIDYGTKTNAEFGTPPMQVVFTPGDRCLSSCSTHNATTWPDTPWDLACSSSSCLVASPTFWSTTRLATITTHVAGVGDVESWTLHQTFPDPGDNTRAGMWLSSLSHQGLVGGKVTVPDVQFTGVQMANRVDPGIDQLPVMNWFRIQTITSETGATISVTYSPPDCVAGSRTPAKPESNTLRCYPVTWTPDSWTTKKQDYFQKYVVTDVHQVDGTGGAPDVVTHYDYLGDPAWHYVDDDGLVPPSQKTWSAWRGYGQVKTTVGTGDDQSVTEETYFRGMDGDHLPTGTRSVTVADSAGNAVADSDALAGRTREKITYDGANEVSGTVTTPWLSAATATRTVGGITVTARHVGDAVVETRTALDGGRGYRKTKVTSTFDQYGMVTQADDTGDEAVSGDEECTRTSYVRNTTAGLLNTTSQVEVDGLPCAQTAGKAADIISDQRTSYDGQSWGTAPTRGDPTQVDTLNGWSGGAPTFITDHRDAYDGYGRVTDAWDIENRHTTTAYSPATGPVTKQTVTDPKGFQTVTDMLPAWGVQAGSTDPNGHRTDLAYDGLGRLTSVWLPGRPKASSTPNTTYAYTIRTGGATAVRTATINPDGVPVTSYTLYDSLLRPRQTQRPTSPPDTGRVITDTMYDSAGRAYKVDDDYIDPTSAPSADLFGPNSDNEIASQVLTRYDGAGRPTARIQMSNNDEKWRTTTSYGGDHTDVTPPAGGVATSTWTDARGHTTQLRQLHDGTYDTTTYQYDNRNLLASITDPRGSRWTYHYDARGRNVQTDDPDLGTSYATYGDAGEKATATDARGDTLAYTYDELGRKTGEYLGSTTGTKVADWTYDTVAKGQPTSSTSYLNGNAYTAAIGGYNIDYQPSSTTYTIPAAEGGLAGSYTYHYTYMDDGSPDTVTMPAAGGLASEVVQTSYDALGEPATLAGQTSYVTGTQYTDFGEPAIYTFASSASAPVVQTILGYDKVTHQQVERKVHRSTNPGTVADFHYTWNPGGELTGVSDTQSDDNQCFSYDGTQRLTQAWTPSSGDCSTSPTAAGLGGPAPYWQTWTYDTAGDRTSATDHATAAGDITTRYSYPVATAAQPHAVASTTTTSEAGSFTRNYGYNADGDTTSMPAADGGTEQLDWDQTGRLASATEGSASSGYVYDTNGQQLIAHDPTGTTLYLPDMELRLATGAATPTATRYYEFGDGDNQQVVGQRTSGGVTWLIPDWQGTDEVAVADNDGQTVTQRRQTPFGEDRGAAASWPNQHGFVNGTDEATGLVNLGARQYDPDLGRFISVDPEFDLTDPQQDQGYAYADNDPTTHSDPTGLHLPCGGESGYYDPCPPDNPSGGTTGCAVLGCGNPNSGGTPPAKIFPNGTFPKSGCGLNSIWLRCTKKQPPKPQPKPQQPKPKPKPKVKPPKGWSKAVCANGMLGIGAAIGIEGCIGFDYNAKTHKRGLYFSATAPKPQDGGLNLGAGVGLTGQYSNTTKDGLAGDGTFISGAAGPVGGSYTAGDGGVYSAEAGVGAGTPSLYVGDSHTWVSPYLFQF